jgi:hypothetical protein
LREILLGLFVEVGNSNTSCKDCIIQMLCGKVCSCFSSEGQDQSGEDRDEYEQKVRDPKNIKQVSGTGVFAAMLPEVNRVHGVLVNIYCNAFGNTKEQECSRVLKPKLAKMLLLN